MKNAMFVGLAIGMVAGAYIASNSKKTRQMLSQAEDQIKSKFCPQGESSQGENGGQSEGSN